MTTFLARLPAKPRMSPYAGDFSSLIFTARTFARIVHDEQVDKVGVAYINHPQRMVEALQQYPLIISDREREANLVCVAYLHDTIEDGGGVVFEDSGAVRYTVEEGIKHIFPDAIYRAVVAITKTPGEPYFEYLRRVKENDLAREVKLADLKDNLDITRFAMNDYVLTEVDLRRMNKYLEAIRFLTDITPQP